jgi:uncharacterized protein YmfQ (DUF2313 family)
MAYVDLYADLVSACIDSAVIDHATDKYLPQLVSLLPPGILHRAAERDGSILRELARALSYEWHRLERRIQQLLDEADPSTTREMVAEWEAVCGLPGDNPSPPTTIAGRRSAIVGLLRGMQGDPSRAWFIDLAAQLGYTVTITEYHDTYTCQSDCDDDLYEEVWRYHWTVSGTSGADDDTVEWIFLRHKPAHTTVNFVWA